MNRRILCQRGFGLVEALIVLLVVATGLLALASFHGDLMASSGHTKARAEALMLARGKIEELANNIQVDQFNASLADTAGAGFSTPETLTGKNAVFSRSWRIEDHDGASTTFKKVLVRVVWRDTRASDGVVTSQNITVNGVQANQQVLLNDMLAFKDPAAIGVLQPPAAGGSGGRGINPKRSGKKGPEMEEGAELVGEAYTLSLPDLLPADAAKFHWRFNSNGNVVLRENVNGTWIVRYTFFGQSIQTVTGKVFYDDVSNPNFTGISVFASEPAYCTRFPYGTEYCPDKKGEYQQCATVGVYACFFSGDCQHGGDGCTTFNPVGRVAGIDDPYTDVSDLDGGWYGKIGIAGLPKDRTVCQADIDTTPTTINSAREYVTVRFNGSTKTWEGINQSFECQNFVVGQIKSNNADAPLDKCTDLINNYSASPPLANIGLPASLVHRSLSGNKASVHNTAKARSSFWCSSRNIVVARSSGANVGGVAASGTTASWPEEECVVWELKDGFACSVPAGDPATYSDDWTGTLTVTLATGEECPNSIFWWASAWNTNPATPASTRVSKTICP